MCFDEKVKALDAYFKSNIKNIKKLVYKKLDDRNKHLWEDVVIELGAEMKKRIHKLKNPEKVESFIHFSLLSAIETVIEEDMLPAKLIDQKSVPDFEDRVYELIKAGYSESKARLMIRKEETINQRCLASKVDTGRIAGGNPKNPDKAYDKPTNEWYDNISDFIMHATSAEDGLLEKEDRNLKKRAVAECLQEYTESQAAKAQNFERDFKIFFDVAFQGVSQVELAKRYSVARARINQIVKKVMNFLEPCATRKYKEMVA